MVLSSLGLTSRNAYFVGTINGSDFPSNSVANEFWLRTELFSTNYFSSFKVGGEADYWDTGIPE